MGLKEEESLEMYSWEPVSCLAASGGQRRRRDQGVDAKVNRHQERKLDLEEFLM